MAGMFDDIQLYEDLIQRGYTSEDLARLVREGRLTRLRRGAYADPPEGDPDPIDIHRALVRATMRQLSDEAVVSHQSAAALHGLPTWDDELDRVHVTRDRS